jgi:hypothetical protein
MLPGPPGAGTPVEAIFLSSFRHDLTIGTLGSSTPSSAEPQPNISSSSEHDPWLHLAFFVLAAGAETLAAAAFCLSSFLHGLPMPTGACSFKQPSSSTEKGLSSFKTWRWFFANPPVAGAAFAV